MEPLLSAIASDLLSRALSMVIQRCMRSKAEDTERKLQRLQRVLLRIDVTVEDAEGRHITNQAMLRQLGMLRQGMYCGHYMLDTFRCRGHVGDDDEVSGDRASAALPGFSSAKRLLFSRVSSDSRENPQDAVPDAENLKKLDKIVGDLELMVADMAEFALFLEGYPRIGRQPYTTYLILDEVMFGRQMEKEMTINFLLRPEAAGDDGNPGVLPIVGAVRVGKSTLVENICLDQRVRGHFSRIVCFTCEDLVAGNMAALGRSGVIKHQDLADPSRGRSLAVIEVSGDVVEEETWRRLYSSVASSMGHGSKIIVTSRSDKIIALGTTQALRLKVLPQEAYWYFFKALAFGSADPDGQPKLTSLGMEIAALLKGTFLGANIVGGMLRANQTIQSWRRILQCLRNFTSKHLLLFGEHPTDLIQKGHSVCIWRLARTQNDVVICNVYEKRSLQHDVPDLLTAHDILTGNATRQGKFRMVALTSKIPPYYTYMATCASLTVRCSVANKKRSRQARI